MLFAKVFFANFSLLIALAYLFNLGYKYIFQHASVKIKYVLTVSVFIIAGWLVMVFGNKMAGTALLDLRFVPLIIAVLMMPNPYWIAVIGVGIGAGRLFIDYDSNSWVAALNMGLLGLLGTALNIWLRQMRWRFVWKSALAVGCINLIYSLFSTAALYVTDTMSPYDYWRDIAGYALPIRIVFSSLLVFIIRDFQKEQIRVDELRTMNMLLRRQTRELRQAKREVEEKARELLLASKYKSEFLANMSHELKTPLNSILLFSQFIRENDDERYEGDEVRYADLIHGAGNDLLQLINDILDLSKVEAGKMDIVFEPVSSHDLVQMLHQQFIPMADQKKVAFETAIAPNVPASLQTDALRVNQILRNLLVNAFKFTEKGSVRLTVRMEGGAPGIEPGPQGRRRILNWNPATWVRPAARPPMVPQRVAFTVHDTGIGIEPEKQQVIFEAFQQEDGAINRKYGGTGLGLSISLQLARLLGGTLTLKSEKGKGSSFTLHLPVRPPSGQSLQE